MQNRQTDIIFIDKFNFNQLQSKDVSLTDLVKVYSDKHFLTINTDDNWASKFSFLTKAFLLKLDIVLQKAVFDSDIFCYNESEYSSDSDKNYIKYAVKDFLTKRSQERVVDIVGSEEKYYEFIPYENGDVSLLLVVVKEEFFSNLTKTKDDFLKFILDCLSYQYKTKVYTGRLLKTYLSVKTTEAQFGLVKLRFESCV